MESNTPEVPLVIDGASVLHQMLQVNWAEWNAHSPEEQSEVVREASEVIGQMESQGSAAFGLFGHKGDLMLIHFRDSFDALHEAEMRIKRLQLYNVLQPTSSYLSVVELGLYDSTQKVYADLDAKGLEAHSPEWDAGIEETLARQRDAMRPRLFPEVPASPYVCFYPMDRLRGEHKNWYQVSLAERARMMKDHGLIGRRYAGTVRQIISGSIGFDDWEWGVDLFAEDPLVFKKLIYEMRFDEVSAIYALFGTFYVGKRYRAAELGRYFGESVGT